MKEIKVRKLTQVEGSNNQCEVMKKNHTRCTTHAAFQFDGEKYNFVCAFHFNIFNSIAANQGRTYVVEPEPDIEDQDSPETRVS